MLLAFDARPLSGSLTGIGRYTHELLKAMVALRPNQRWLALSHQPIHPDVKIPEVIETLCSNWSFPADGVVWSQTALPILLRKIRPSIFWSPRHHLPMWGVPKNVKLMLTVHDLVYKHFPQTMRTSNLWAERLLFDRSLKRADSVMAVSRFTKKEIESTFPSEARKVTVVPGATFSNSDIAQIDIPSNFILAVGTLEPRKNLDKLIQAFHRLPSHLKQQYKLVIAGGTGWRNAVQESQLDSDIMFTGYISDSQLNFLYSKAACFVFPSLYEGFGLPVLEAFRHGTPTIVSSAASLPEVAGKGALLIDPYDIDDISHKIQQVLTNPVLRLQLQEQALAQESLFSWESSALSMWEAIDSILLAPFS